MNLDDKVQSSWSGKIIFTCRAWLQAECITGALSMLSIHSPDYVFYSPGKYIEKQNP